MTDVSTTLILRPYAPADWPRLCAIHDAARMDELRLSVGTAAFLNLEETYDTEGLFDGACIVAERDGVVRGFVAFTETALTWLYVEPGFYRRGIGRALLRHAVAAAAPGLELELLDGNAPALGLYASEGFTLTRRVDGQLEGNDRFAATGLVLHHWPHGT